MLRLSSILIGAAILGINTSPASAFNVSVGGISVPGQGQFSSEPGTTTIDFENGAPNSGFAVYSAPSPGPAVVQGSAGSGIYIAPPDDKTRYLTVSPFGDSRGTRPVTITLKSLHNYFGLYWGSIDDYNSISFFKDDTLVKTFSGADIGVDAGYVNFKAGNNESFNQIILDSSEAALESDNHAFKAVPEPLTLLGSATALGIGGLFKRQQSKKLQKDQSLV